MFIYHLPTSSLSLDITVRIQSLNILCVYLPHNNTWAKLIGINLYQIMIANNDKHSRFVLIAFLYLKLYLNLKKSSFIFIRI